jgi:hypothetical protein
VVRYAICRGDESTHGVADEDHTVHIISGIPVEVPHSEQFGVNQNRIVEDVAIIIVVPRPLVEVHSEAVTDVRAFKSSAEEEKLLLI